LTEGEGVLCFEIRRKGKGLLRDGRTEREKNRDSGFTESPSKAKEARLMPEIRGKVQERERRRGSVGHGQEVERGHQIGRPQPGVRNGGKRFKRGRASDVIREKLIPQSLYWNEGKKKCREGAVNKPCKGLKEGGRSCREGGVKTIIDPEGKVGLLT